MSSYSERPDPIEGILDVTSQAEERERARDKKLGTQLHIGRSYLVASALIVLLATTLIMPHSQGVLGIDVLLNTEVAQQQQTSLPSFIFVLFYTVGTVGFGSIMLLTQKWWAAGVAWGTTCIAAVYGMLAIWLRQSGRGANPDAVDFGPPSFGIYTAWLCVLALAVVLAVVLWTKTPQQRALEDEVREFGN